MQDKNNFTSTILIKTNIHIVKGKGSVPDLPMCSPWQSTNLNHIWRFKFMLAANISGAPTCEAEGRRSICSGTAKASCLNWGPNKPCEPGRGGALQGFWPYGSPRGTLDQFVTFYFAAAIALNKFNTTLFNYKTNNRSYGISREVAH